jgi:hypothetical protein
MKYYRADSLAKSANIRTLERTLDKSSAETKQRQQLFIAEEASLNSAHFKILLDREVAGDRLSAFTKRVDNYYVSGFQAHYRDFSRVYDPIVGYDILRRLANECAEMFPLVYSMLANIIDSGRKRLATSPICGDQHENLSGSESETDNRDSSSVVRDNRKLLFPLFHFLSLIRTRSQKELPHWSILLPLANFSKGVGTIPNNSMVSGYICHPKTAFNRVNQIFEESQHALLSRIKASVTISACFDNYQQSLPKKKQADCKSATFHIATAYICKKDKVPDVEEGSVIRSPLGKVYKIRGFTRLNEYALMLRGETTISTDVLLLLTEQERFEYRNKAAVFNAVERTEIVLHRSGVFASHAPETMNTDKFWKNVVRPRVSGTDTDRRNESCQLSPHEQNTMATINTIDNMQTAAETNDTDNNDDESVESSSVASRRTLSSVQNEPDDYNPLDNEDVHGDTEEDRNVFDAVDYLKHLGKMKKIPFSKSSLDDISELMVDRAEAYIKKQRDKFSMDTERNADIIEMSIRNYGEMMTRRREFTYKKLRIIKGNTTDY